MVQELSFKNKYNDILYGHKRIIEDSATSLKGNILIVTGMAEHSLRYNDFASFLNSLGYNVYSLNHYGQGEKNGELMNPCDDYFFKMIETIKDFNKMLKSLNNDKPLINIAHSMGSFIMQGYIEKYSETIDKCILIGSNGRNSLVKVGYFLSKILINKGNENKKAKLFHNLSIGAYEKSVKNKKISSVNEWLSYNLENVKKYDEDPLSGVRPTNKFYKNFLKGLSTIQKEKNIDNISKTLPILILGGKEDPVGNNGKGLVSLTRIYKNHNLNVTLKLYDHMRHEILNEDEHMKVYNDIKDFVLK